LRSLWWGSSLRRRSPPRRCPGRRCRRADLFGRQHLGDQPDANFGAGGNRAVMDVTGSTEPIGAADGGLNMA